jgi:hypothetical protein
LLFPLPFSLRVSLCSWGWPWNHDLPAFWVTHHTCILFFLEPCLLRLSSHRFNPIETVPVKVRYDKTYLL